MDNRTLKYSAAQALSGATYPPGRLALLHTGASVLLTALTTLVSFLLTRQIDATTGLSTLDTRTVLMMAQMLLTIATVAVLPFWEYGFLRAAMGYSRREQVTPATLLEGFRRFGPVLRLILLRSVLVMGVAFLCIQAASILFTMTPLSIPFMQQVETLLATTDPTALDAAAIEGLMEYLYPVYILFGVLLCVVLIPILYRLRLADYMVLDGTHKALFAMHQSSQRMRGNRLTLFKLDLGFWWYYLLLLLCTVLAYGDKLLPILGITMDPDLAFWTFYIISIAAQLAITWRFAPLVQTTYAMFYDQAASRR